MKDSRPASAARLAQESVLAPTRPLLSLPPVIHASEPTRFSRVPLDSPDGAGLVVYPLGMDQPADITLIGDALHRVAELSL
jgi:hypothetical protein